MPFEKKKIYICAVNKLEFSIFSQLKASKLEINTNKTLINI